MITVLIILLHFKNKHHRTHKKTTTTIFEKCKINFHVGKLVKLAINTTDTSTFEVYILNACVCVCVCVGCILVLVCICTWTSTFECVSIHLNVNCIRQDICAHIHTCTYQCQLSFQFECRCYMCIRAGWRNKLLVFEFRTNV